MIALTRQTLIRSLPVYGAVVGGLIAAAAVLLASTDTLESAVWTTGVAALVPAAAPPLGTTARALLAVGSGALVAALLWSSLFLLFGPGGVFAKASPREDGVPVIRRADAHPDAPPRKPMSAADLGTPMMEVGVGGSGGARDEQTIPADLDQPLAAFDPHAILPVPMEPVRPVSPLAQVMVAPVVEAPSTARPDTFVTAPLVEPIERSVEAADEGAVTDGIAEDGIAEDGVAKDGAEKDGVQRVGAPEINAPTPIARPARATDDPTSPPTIEALLRRLEQGALRRGRIGTH